MSRWKSQIVGKRCKRHRELITSDAKIDVKKAKKKKPDAEQRKALEVMLTITFVRSSTQTPELAGTTGPVSRTAKTSP